MFRKFLITMFLLFTGGMIWADADAKVILNESVLDKFLDAVGPISRTEKFSVMNISGEYTWFIKNPKMLISKDKVRFQADASVKVLKYTYDTSAYGDVEVKYDETANKISVKILKTAIKIYVNLFGKHIDITEVDISKYYKMQFEFPGPEPLQTAVNVTLPNDTVRKVSVKAAPKMSLEDHQIVVGSELTFTGQDKK